MDNPPSIVALGLLLLSVTYAYYARSVAPPAAPNTPTTVSYLIPWIGSFFSFNRDPLKFLEKCHLRYGKAYKVTMVGRTIVIITDPDGVSLVSRDINHLNHKAVYIHILRAIGGLGPKSVDFIQDLLDNKIFPMVKTTLSPALMLEVTDKIDLLLPRELEALHASSSSSLSLNLSVLIGRPIYNAGCCALFGPSFPFESFHDFVQLDAHLPQMLTRLPIIAQLGKAARFRMVSSLERYMEAWWDSDGTEDIPGASPTVMLSLIDLKASQVSRQEAAGTLLLFLWVDSTSMTRLVKDIDNFRLTRSGDQLNGLGSGPPLLEAAVQETFRWATTSTTARLATDDTTVVVDGVAIPILKGEWVFGDIRAVHHDPKVYNDPHGFKIDRYAEGTPGASSAPRASPWGQGKHMCPGRHVAMHVMRSFVSELLSTYEVAPIKQPMGHVTIPPISSRHFLGSLKSTEDVPVMLFRR